MYLIRKILISGFAMQIPPEFSVTTLCLANCIDWKCSDTGFQAEGENVSLPGGTYFGLCVILVIYLVAINLRCKSGC